MQAPFLLWSSWLWPFVDCWPPVLSMPRNCKYSFLCNVGSRHGACQWPDLYEVATVVVSWTLWLWIPIRWSFIGTDCVHWGSGLTHLWVSLICCLESLLQKHTFLWLSKVPEPTQDIFLSLNTVLNWHQYILVTMVFIHFRTIDIEGGEFLFSLSVSLLQPWKYILLNNASFIRTPLSYHLAWAVNNNFPWNNPIKFNCLT